MTPRERVFRCLAFDHPDRAPRDLWVLPWAEMNLPEELASIRAEFPPEIVRPPVSYTDPPRTLGAQHRIGTYTDEWGCEFVNIQDGVMGEVKRPVVADWNEALGTVSFPVGWLTFDRDRVNAFHRSDSRFVLADCTPRPFEQLQFLRGAEDLYADLARPSPSLIRFIEKMHTFYCDLFAEWAKTEVDGLMFMDDWGAQTSLLVSPKTWRNLFKPLYRDYIEIGHRAGKRMFMHSDGYILDILEDLVEIGLDALNSQVFCMGPERLAPFRGRIAFWGEIDRQYLLPQGSLEEIRQAVESFHAHLHHHGGVIAQCEFGLLAKPDNVREVFRSWDRLTR